MRTVFMIAIVLVFFACNDNKAEKTVVAPPPPKYYFYPKANVYFDTVNKDYIFLGNDGKTWISEKQIPAAMHSMMDKSILLVSFSQPVWKDNENHKLVYSAVLYAAPGDTVEREEPKPVIVRKPADSDTDTVDEKKERKGLRKFLDKIFGKKEKDTTGN